VTYRKKKNPRHTSAHQPQLETPEGSLGTSHLEVVIRGSLLALNS
jgi:hypothetical protein